ncbi:MAG: hypothetical protein CMC35_00630 [Flavobacteriaceae bacterium]|nr:hypothetical protein [Flavobacteriaceae bacterium]|tara:strand:- start:717 stop:1901 length:1185 start_codon:yes stop_codon:yes gene_type:complete
MKTNYFIVIVVLLFIGCNSVKRTQKMVTRGEYDRAIDLAVKKLQKDRISEKSEAQKLLLEEAFRKAVADDKRQLTKLQQESNPAFSRAIYYRYLDLDARQQAIRPLLPLNSAIQNRTLSFVMIDYTDELIASKRALIDYLYDEANYYYGLQTISDYRTAYNIFCEIEELSPNFKDTRQLRDDARFGGTDFVIVSLVNQSGAFLPYRLERDLLDFNTYGLDTFWTEFHASPNPSVDYTYGIDLRLRELWVSPDQVSEQTFRRSKQVVDGYEARLDRNGNVVRDSLGNPVQQERLITVRASVTYTIQQKAARVGGEVMYFDLLGNQQIDRHPLGSEFIFENRFAKFRGDERALTDEDRRFISGNFIPFPSEEQMLVDTGTQLKQQLRERIERQSFD